MTEDDRIRDVAELRRAFDEAFAEPIRTRSEVPLYVLHVRAGDRELALRVSEIASIMRCPTLVSLPSDQPALRGLAAIRGNLVAVYDISGLRGGDPIAGSRPWVVCCASDPSVGLSFDELAGYEAVDPHAVVSQDAGEVGTSAQQVVRLEAGQLELISIRSLLDSMRRGARVGADKER